MTTQTLAPLTPERCPDCDYIKVTPQLWDVRAAHRGITVNGMSLDTENAMGLVDALRSRTIGSDSYVMVPRVLRCTRHGVQLGA